MKAQPGGSTKFKNVLRRGGVLLVLAAFAAIIGSAQAASSKPYSANVHQTLNTPGSFTLTLTNDPSAQQSVGSANFTPPRGFTATGTPSHVTRSGWNVTVDSAGVVEFRSTSSSTALPKGQSVSADVTVTVPSQCPAGATWGVDARQSNDFSGQPGNFLSLNAAASDLTPLGSFTFAPIGTILTDPAGLFVPQVRIIDGAFPVSVHALDTCGAADLDYNNVPGAVPATLAPTPTLVPARSVTVSALTFSSGLGSATGTPKDVEAADTLTVKDPTTGISADSTASGTPATPNTAFDVVETICAVAGTTCNWHNKNSTILATSTVPSSTDGIPSIGLGFKTLSATCTPPGGGTPLSSKGEGIEIVPVNYTSPYTITLTYAKSLSGNGSTTIILCLTKDHGVTWNFVPDCASTVPVNTTPCVQSSKRVTGGALQIVLLLSPGDPGAAGF